MAEEVIKEHLSEISPYSPLESQQLPYPLAKPTKPGVYHDQLPPTWMQKNAIHKVKKTGKYKYIYSGDSWTRLEMSQLAFWPFSLILEAI